MAQKQTRSRKFIIGVNEVVELITADELDSSNNNLIDEKDVIFLEKAMSDTDDTIAVTIDDAHAQSIEPNVVEPLSHLFYWKKICISFDIRNCSLSGTVNLSYEDGHEPKPIEIFSDTIKLETPMNLVSERSELYMQQKGIVFKIEINELKAFILFYFIYFISIFILLTHGKATEALIHRVGNHPDLLPEIPRYCCPL